MGNVLKPKATINLPKSRPFLGNLCKSVKIYHFSSEIILGKFYRHLAIFSGHSGHKEHNQFLNDLRPSSHQDLISNQFCSNIITLCGNKALQSVKISYVTSNIQSECFISAQCGHAPLDFL